MRRLKSKVITDPARVDRLLSRGIAEIVDKAHLKAALLSGKQLRIKLGIDPTGENLHLGHSINLLKLKDFQDLGHQIVFIIGDATAEVGDTSDKDSERPMLVKKEIQKNKKTYLAQVGKIIDLSCAEVEHNGKWLNKLTFRDIGEQANLFSVSDFISRDNIKRRLTAGKRVSLRETLYPLMQGYDSVAVRANVELGGTDQWFNLLAGRVMQEYYKQEPQDILITRILTAGDGRKMSKSLGNTINILDAAEDMYGKAMRIDDVLITEYMELTTRIPEEEILEYKQRLVAGENPKNIKQILARVLVSTYHSEKDATKAEDAFQKTFSEKKMPDTMPEVLIEEGETLENALPTTLMSSKSHLRRLVAQGAVHDMESGEKIKDSKRRIVVPLILKLGKRTFVRITVRKKKKE
ncbi:MAG: tyrosine--tRNA ligase [Patescibacteria group bacterium]